MGALRNRFANLEQDLQNLQQIPNNNPQAFANGLARFGDNTPIRRLIRNIDFLGRIREGITHQVVQWGNPLLLATQQVHNLALPPQSDGTSLRGMLVGTSDIVNAPNHNTLYAFNTLFIDADLRRPSNSYSFISPKWIVQGTRLINLSGNDGTPGQVGSNGGIDQPGGNGQPGGHGSHGGHFYGKGIHFTGFDRLTITTNGGNGGRGGNGGQGGPGRNGIDANQQTHTNTVGYRRPQQGYEVNIADPFIRNWLGDDIA